MTKRPEENRNSRRLPADDVCAAIAVAGDDDRDQSFGVVLNVSSTGICVRTPQAPPLDADCEVRVNVGEELYEFPMVVRRCESAERRVWTVGLEFREGADEEAQSEFLEAFLLSRWARSPGVPGMTDRKWLDAYSGQTTEQLIALAAEYRTDSVVLAVEQALDQKSERMGETALTDEERVVLAVEALEREVNNGGYWQFFDNSSCEYAPLIVDALQRIGAATAAELTHEAVAALGLGDSVTVDAVEEVLGAESEELQAALEACDQRYVDEVGDLSEPLLAFITENQQRITL